MQTLTRDWYTDKSTFYTYRLLTLNDEIAAQVALEAERPVSWQMLVRQLEDDPSLLSEAYQVYVSTGQVPANPNDPLANCTCATCTRVRRRRTVSSAAFLEAVEETTGEEALMCYRCAGPGWADHGDTDIGDVWVCESCRQDISSCERCGDWSATDDYFLYWLNSEAYCCECRESYLSWCEDCDEYYHPDNSDEHRHLGCECRPRTVPLRFEVPANSHGSIKQDERLLVELPAGFITDEALEAALSLLWLEQYRLLWIEAGHPYQDFAQSGVVQHEELLQALHSLDRNWQTREGNFTRRLSKVLHTRFQSKLDPGLLSRVGSTIREHTSNSNQWYVEFTRDFNQPAEAFYNEESCWFGNGSEAVSRCSLKHLGGVGMRSYADATVDRCWPNGRVWVQPLNESLQPTLDVLGAHAYLVYNGYGEMSGYTGARLVAYLASRTYRKVGISISPQYVNGSTGFLIADQETCDAHDYVSIAHYDYHQAVSA